MHWRTRFLLHAGRIIILPSLLVNTAVRFLPTDLKLNLGPQGSLGSLGPLLGSLLGPLGLGPQDLDLSVLSRLGQTRTSQVLLSLLAISTYIWLQSSYTHYINNSNASKLNARTIPIAKGKYPWNIDLLIRLTQTPRQAYVGARMYELFAEYKTNTLNIRPLGMDLIITCDHGHIKEILATGFGNWEKGYVQCEKLYEFFGKGIFSVDGDEWKAHRAMTRPFFKKERISDFDTFWKYGQYTLDILRETADSKLPVIDIQDIMARFTMDSASEFMFGKCLETLKMKRPEPGKAKLGIKGSAHVGGEEDQFGDFASAFEAAQMVMSVRTVRGQIWPLFELFGSKTVGPMKVVSAFLDPLIRSAQQKVEVKHHGKRGKQESSNDADVEVESDSSIIQEDGEGSKTLLEELVESIDNPVTVRDELLAVLLAGRDTTASLLTFAIYLMSLHPDVKARVEAEIADVCGDGQIQPTYAMIKKLRYMRAVLDETMRLFPPVPLNQRASNRNCSLPPSDCLTDPDKRPYYVPAYTSVTYSPILMQRSEALWGPDAHEFKPERWLDLKAAASYNANFMFIPFNAGPRICLGQNFAYNEASFMLAILLPHFTFTCTPEYQPEGSLPLEEWKHAGKGGLPQMGRVKDEKIWPLSSMTMYSKGGLWMRVERKTA